MFFGLFKRKALTYQEWCAEIARLADKAELPLGATCIADSTTQLWHKQGLTPKEVIRVLQNKDVQQGVQFGRALMDGRLMKPYAFREKDLSKGEDPDV